MAHDYVDQKVNEAIALSGGSDAKATQLLIEWAIDDQMLLLALTQNHLKGIASLAVSHANAKGGGRIEKAKGKSTPAPEKPKPIDMPVESFGCDLLNALSSRDTVRFGMEGAVGRPIVTRKKKASQQHIDSLKKISENRSGTRSTD